MKEKKRDSVFEDSATAWSDFQNQWFGPDESESLHETPYTSDMPYSDNRQILNILFMIDISGSMLGKRIAQVNYALENIFKELKQTDDVDAVIKIGIMEFSDYATWTTPQPIPLDDYIFSKIEAGPYVTNYGNAFDKLEEKLHSKQFMNPALGEYYAPIIIFVTDGEPLDEKEYPLALERLQKNKWFNKSMKYAIATGEEAKNEEVARILAEFTGEPKNVRYADEGDALINMIEYITITSSISQTTLISRAGPDDTSAMHFGGHDYEGSRSSSIFEEEDPALFSGVHRK